MALTAITLLGENTVPILDRLCRWLTGEIRTDVVAAAPRPGSSATAGDRAQHADVIWACGYLLCDLVDSGRLDADIVAAPVFDGSDRPVYHSVVVAADPAIVTIRDAAGGRVAINEPISWSGHLAFLRHLEAVGADPSDYARVVVTGSHRASIDAVAEGRADVAAIDHTVWAHLRSRPDAERGVRVVARTRDWPAPPFAVGRRVPTIMRGALVDALVAVSSDSVGGLAAVVPATRDDYAEMSPPPG